LAEIPGQAGEEVRLGQRQIYLHYGDGGQIETRDPGGGRHRPQPEHHRQVDSVGWISSIAGVFFAGSVEAGPITE
jgi:hypothetical protein